MKPIAAALAAALLAAALLPGHPLGLAAPIIVVVIVAAATAAARPLSAHALAFAAAAVVLASMAAVRDAGWVVAIDLVAAALLASLAVAGGARAIELATGSVAMAIRLAAVPELAAELHPHAANVRRLAPAGRGLALGTVVVIPFGALFWSADGAFAAIGSSVPLPDLSSWPSRLAVFALVLAAGTGLVLAARRPPVVAPIDVDGRLATAEWAIPLALLDLLFLAFVLVQLTVLFGGREHVLETAGLTYAEYARQGFVQLLVASALTLGVVAIATKIAFGSRTLLRALLGVLCVLTLVVLASALRRLGLYEDAYGFTRLRLTADAVGLWLGGIFCLVLVAGAAGRSRWLPRAVVAFTALALIAFSLVNPDGLVAAKNVDRWRKTGKLDVGYLASLSADAVPALVALPEPLRDRALERQRRLLRQREPWGSANLARHRARRALAV